MTFAAQVAVPTGQISLIGDLVIPEQSRGLVLFAHGSGSSRHSPRNRAVAAELQAAGLATLLVDLLTEDEERQDARTGQLRFDIGLLSDRLTAVADWLAQQDETADLGLGLFGASTGAAAALVTAATRPEAVRAVVSRGGRPDLASDFLTRVEQPTLLMVGGRDTQVIQLNRDAMTMLVGPADLEVVPGATHLFEEPGALDVVARLARDWFVRYFG